MGAGPGRWNDPDMLLAGNDCVTDDEATTQFVVWSIVAAPLIMGNDLRKVPASMKKLLLNPEIIAIDQDPLGKPGGRRTKYPGSIEREPARRVEVDRHRQLSAAQF